MLECVVLGVESVTARQVEAENDMKWREALSKSETTLQAELDQLDARIKEINDTMAYFGYASSLRPTVFVCVCLCEVCNLSLFATTDIRACVLVMTHPP
jgi:hypothetical protein